jgi:peptide/nickel transport system ATP-binding protein
MTDAPPPALAIEDLSVSFRVRGGDRRVVQGVSLAIGPGEAYGLVGESGCGKSTIAYATVGYLARNGRISGGRIAVAGRDLTQLGGDELRRLRAGAVSMVYQDPGRALNPSLKIGRQMAEVYEPQGIGRRAALDRAAEMLQRVRIADPKRVLDRYPHQLSGGMQQRVCIAMALAINPALLILDEPTTGLDATVEAEVLDLVRQLRAEFNTAILCISHNLGVIATLCERVGVLYAGTLVEEGSAAELFAAPRHPYTVGLLRCLPQRGRRKDQGPLDTIPGFLPLPDQSIQGCVFAERCGLAQAVCRTTPPPAFDLGGGRRSRCHFWQEAPNLPRSEPALPAAVAAPADAPPLLAVEHLSKTFHLKGHSLKAVHDVSLSLRAGETLGLVGESGSGKTTFARLLLGLVAPDRADSLKLRGRPLPGLLDQRSQAEGKALQIVFQNPDSALNRAHAVRRIIGRAIGKLAGLTGRTRDQRLLEVTRAVRLPDRTLGAKPRQLSGGLKQRVAIARAFAGEPELVVCDEPTSALDVSVQSAILNLFVELQARRQVSYIFISHDLGVVRFLSDRIAVLYLGRLMEVGPAEAVFSGPQHPYTEALLSAVPSIDGRRATRIRLTGEIPSASNPPPGCVFHTRCARKIAGLCDSREPPPAEAGPGHVIHCHIPVEELARLQAADRLEGAQQPAAN